ncbi:MAG TPA: choice-of-anchor tandem repeat GloVer-containing protein [Verrucomicrobiae bacterium]|jgi:uncharacterized repeat protein (TIGR03803 family)|nr:choice-of-anchor tandem repeat GloVer-containing protein [Verrucomicrobiae bacterium]
MTTLKRWLLGGLLCGIFHSAHAGLINLYTFTDGVDGASPQSGLAQASNGVFYGTALNGGTNGFGTIFSVTSAGAFTPLYSFTADVDGAAPWSALAPLTNGAFAGTTIAGANGFGTIFQVTSNGVLTPRYSFTGTTDGSTPEGTLTLSTNGSLYGTTADGGANGAGTIYRFTPAGAFNLLYTFTGSVDGVAPVAALTLGADGNFYGTTASGGTNGDGTIFKLTQAGVFTSLYSFSNGVDGAIPQSALTLGSDGNLYGVTSSGGAHDNGTLFRLTSAGKVVALYSFSSDNGSGTNADGIGPTSLLQARDGNLYGTTGSGGAFGSGTIFRATLAGAVTTLYTFGAISSDSVTNVDGSDPTALIQGRDGNLYGTTVSGGPDAQGTIFEFSTSAAVAFSGVTYTNGQAILTLTGLTGQGSTVIDASTNLTQWTPILTNPPATGQASLTDPAAHNFPHRFYRARSVLP